MWHIENASFVLRRYAQPGGYEQGLAFTAVACAKTIGPGVVFIEGALSVDSALKVSDWRAMGRTLREQHGVHTIRARRSGREVTYDTARF